MLTLVICEKPSQAQGYAAVLCANKREMPFPKKTRATGGELSLLFFMVIETHIDNHLCIEYNT
jgi:hypothetical protein